MFRVLRIGAISVAAVLLAATAVATNLSDATLRQSPAFASMIFPSNGLARDALVRIQLALHLQHQQQQQQAEVIKEARKQGLLSADQVRQLQSEFLEAQPINFDSVERDARKALRHEPFALASLLALSHQAQLEHEDELANRLLSHAGHLSRRNALIQMELIQQAANSGDMRSLVRHVDETLRTNQSMFGTIFPILARGLTDPRLVTFMKPIAAADPVWYHRFVGEALTIPTALPAVRELMLVAPNGRAAQDAQLRANLVSQLVATNRIGLARSYFRALHPEATGEPFDPEFKHPEYEAPFGWIISEDPDLTADFVQNEGLVAFAASDREGIVARQLLSLQPGRHTAQLDAPPESLKIMTLYVTCRASGRTVPVTPQRNAGTFQFFVPGNCIDQWFSLRLRDDDDTQSAEATIRRVRLN